MLWHKPNALHDSSFLSGVGTCCWTTSSHTRKLQCHITATTTGCLNWHLLTDLWQKLRWSNRQCQLTLFCHKHCLVRPGPSLQDPRMLPLSSLHTGTCAAAEWEEKRRVYFHCTAAICSLRGRAALEKPTFPLFRCHNKMQQGETGILKTAFNCGLDYCPQTTTVDWASWQHDKLQFQQTVGTNGLLRKSEYNTRFQGRKQLSLPTPA